MPMKVRYTVVNGQVIAENRNGVRKTYVPDPSGSTIALLDDTQKITDTFSYSPFGELKSRTGTTPTPFQSIGTRGYYTDPNHRIYVRARTYQPNYARWMSVDPLWPSESAYGYARGNPVRWVDATGLFTIDPCEGCPRPTLRGWFRVDCSCVGGLHLWVIPEQDKKAITPVKCGRWYPSDGFAIEIGDLRFVIKIPGGTCVTFYCRPDFTGIGVCQNLLSRIRYGPFTPDPLKRPRDIGNYPKVPRPGERAQPVIYPPPIRTKPLPRAECPPKSSPFIPPGKAPPEP